MDITSESRVGEIAAQHPLATRVFARHQIDFCCGGGTPLRDVCDRRGLSTDEILEEIRETLAESPPNAERWNEAPTAELVRHIIRDYHEPLREELPRLEAMTRKVARVHGARAPERFEDLLQTFLNLKNELEDHMEREESEIFPRIVSSGESASIATDAFIEDHEEAGRALLHLRELTDEFRVPEGACNTWRALWHGLEALEGALHRHIHLENNVLFPKVASS